MTVTRVIEILATPRSVAAEDVEAAVVAAVDEYAIVHATACQPVGGGVWSIRVSATFASVNEVDTLAERALQAALRIAPADLGTAPL